MSFLITSQQCVIPLHSLLSHLIQVQDCSLGLFLEYEHPGKVFSYKVRIARVPKKSSFLHGGHRNKLLMPH